MTVLNNEALGTEKIIPLDASKIQEMMNGTFTNNGFFLKTDAELNDHFYYKTSDSSVQAQRPKLVIQYTLSDSTPTPSSTPTLIPDTSTPESSPTPTGPTSTPTTTFTPSNTPTSTATPTLTPTLTPTFTLPPTIAPTPTTPIFSNAQFTYDGDGRRVKSVLTTNAGSTTRYFIGNHYEVANGVVTKYYYAGSQRVAMRKNSVLSYLLSDHLDSTSIVTDASGNLIFETGYKAWGETRYTSGTEQTKYTYTGQYSYTSDFGLMFYNARWYDPSLGRFAQADTIVPEENKSQSWDRYSYTFNNPIIYNDPSGHWPFPPDPFSYDTLSIGIKGLLKELAGIEGDIVFNINIKAIKELDLENMDVSVGLDFTLTGGVSAEGAIGVVVYGNEGTVLDQSEFQLIGDDGEFPVQAGGCLEGICASALYTIDVEDPDGLSGEGFFFGLGSPAGIDISADIIGGSDHFLYGKWDSEDSHMQVPFVNEKFIKTVPFLKTFFEQ